MDTATWALIISILGALLAIGSYFFVRKLDKENDVDRDVMKQVDEEAQAKLKEHLALIATLNKRDERQGRVIQLLVETIVKLGEVDETELRNGIDEIINPPPKQVKVKPKNVNTI